MIQIDLFSDIVCPWCFIGSRNLDAALAGWTGEPARVTYRPFLLDPSTPPEGVDLRESLRRKFGGDPEPMFARVEGIARQSGIPLDFSKVRRMPATLPAHALLRRAAEKGDQKALADAIFTAYFLEGRDVSRPEVLEELAVARGFASGEATALLADPAELQATAAEARAAAARGVRSVPLFVFAGRLALSGAQPPAAIRQALEKAAQG